MNKTILVFILLMFTCSVVHNFSGNAHMNFGLGLCYLKSSDPDKKLAKKYLKKAEKEGAVLPKEIRTAIE